MSWLPGFEPSQVIEDSHDGAGDSWFTPRLIVDAVASAMGGIDLDPCAHPGSPTWEIVKHRISLSKGGDGLTDEWKGAGGVFVNPPYSDIGPWIRLAREHSRRRPVIMLIPTRPETRAWDAEILSAGGCIVQQVGRVRFVGADGQTHGNGMITTCFVTWDQPLAHRLQHALGRRGVRSHVLISDGVPW